MCTLKDVCLYIIMNSSLVNAPCMTGVCFNLQYIFLLIALNTSECPAEKSMDVHLSPDRIKVFNFQTSFYREDYML